MSLSVFATITPLPEYLSTARAAIQEMMTETRAEAGCLSFDLHEDSEIGRLYLHEIWADQAAFDAHHAQPYTQAVFARYETWLARPVDCIFMQPVA